MGVQSTSIDDRDLELLSQMIDGELDPAARAALERRLAGEASLRDTLASLQALNSALRAAAQRHPGVPPQVEDLLRKQPQASTAAGEAGKVLPFPGTPSAAQPRRPAWPLALAASLLLVAGATWIALERGTADSTLPGDDRLVGDVLESAPSGSSWRKLGDGRAVQPVLTFAHRDGTWCREFLLRDGGQDWRAVACRSGDRWQTQAVGREAYLEGGAGYRPAGAGDAAPVALFISENAADIALDRQRETSLIERGWE